MACSTAVLVFLPFTSVWKCAYTLLRLHVRNIVRHVKSASDGIEVAVEREQRNINANISVVLILAVGVNHILVTRLLRFECTCANNFVLLQRVDTLNRETP